MADPTTTAARQCGHTHDQPAACAMGTHDWRRDPFTTLASNPPRYRIVCAACGQVSSRPTLDTTTYDQHDVRTWPRVRD